MSHCSISFTYTHPAYLPLSSTLVQSPKCTDVCIKISTPGKVILHGEHSVVYGRVAIAASLGLRTKVHLQEDTNLSDNAKKFVLDLKAVKYRNVFDLQEIQSKLLNSGVEYAQNESQFNFRNPDEINHETVLKLVETFVAQLPPVDQYQTLAITSLFYLFTGIFVSVNIPLNSLSLTVETELNVSAGTGSSASYLVSIAAAFVQFIRLKWVQIGLDNVSKPQYKEHRDGRNDLGTFDSGALDVISKWAQNAEMIIHGKVSGIDNTICTYGSLVEFKKGSAPKIVKISHNFMVLLVNTKIPRNTKTLVAKVADLRDRFPDVVESLLDSLDGIARRAIEILASNTDSLYKDIGDLVDLNHNVLRTLGVSHPALDLICEKVAQFGLHGKLTGAGGGGYAIAIVPPLIEKGLINELCSTLESLGYEAVLTEIGGPGVLIMD